MTGSDVIQLVLKAGLGVSLNTMATVKAYICLKHLKEGTIFTGQGPHLNLIFDIPCVFYLSLSDHKFRPHQFSDF